MCVLCKNTYGMCTGSKVNVLYEGKNMKLSVTLLKKIARTYQSMPKCLCAYAWEDGWEIEGR